MSDYGIHVIITGDVQGVGYRAWAASKAEELSLNGWIRNLSDGSVEALFFGDADAVHEMLEECEVGPHAARVDDVDSQELESDDYPDLEEGFYIRSNA